MLNKHNIILF